MGRLLVRTLLLVAIAVLAASCGTVDREAQAGGQAAQLEVRPHDAGRWPVPPPGGLRFANELLEGLGSTFRRDPPPPAVQQRARSLAGEAGNDRLGDQVARDATGLACQVHEGMPEYVIERHPNFAVRLKASILSDRWRQEQAGSIDAKEAVDALCELVP